MTHEEAVFEVLAYRRNVGATLDEVLANVGYRVAGTPARNRVLQTLQNLVIEGELFAVGGTWFLTPSGYKKARGTALEPEWQREDAWILLAALLGCRDEGSDLSRLIGAADYISHGIPNHEELHGAINRLRSGRLLKTKGNTIAVTQKATELFEKVEATCKRAVLRQLDGLRRLMDCPCCGVELKAVRWGYELDEGTVADAVASYRSRF